MSNLSNHTKTVAALQDELLDISRRKTTSSEQEQQRITELHATADKLDTAIDQLQEHIASPHN